MTSVPAASPERSVESGPSHVDWDGLRSEITRQFRLGNFSVHGPDHWRRVATIGARLAAETGADPTVVRLFALLHDACRASDWKDASHGPRAARLAAALQERYFHLSEAQLAQLVEAVEGHTSGRVSTDPTVGTCWDADRLDLMRVGLRPNPRFLSTDAARRPDTIDWAVGLSS